MARKTGDIVHAGHKVDRVVTMGNVIGEEGPMQMEEGPVPLAGQPGESWTAAANRCGPSEVATGGQAPKEDQRIFGWQIEAASDDTTPRAGAILPYARGVAVQRRSNAFEAGKEPEEEEREGSSQERIERPAGSRGRW